MDTWPEYRVQGTRCSSTYGASSSLRALQCCASRANPRRPPEPRTISGLWPGSRPPRPTRKPALSRSPACRLHRRRPSSWFGHVPHAGHSRPQRALCKQASLAPPHAPHQASPFPPNDSYPSSGPPSSPCPGRRSYAVLLSARRRPGYREAGQRSRRVARCRRTARSKQSIQALRRAAEIGGTIDKMRVSPQNREQARGRPGEGAYMALTRTAQAAEQSQAATRPHADGKSAAATRVLSASDDRSALRAEASGATIRTPGTVM